MLSQEITQDRSARRKRTLQEELIGTAILRRDNFTGKKYWTTWDGKGHNEATFSAGQPLTFLPEVLQVGTRIHLLPPETWDDGKILL